MNRDSSPPVAAGRPDRQALEARYALRVAATLSAQAEALPHDLSERLRFAREQAIARARRAPLRQGRPAAGSGEPHWWWRLASLVPVVALAAGLVLIQREHEDEQVQAVADLDAALLADDLPPAAYADAGFAEFLRRRGD